MTDARAFVPDILDDPALFEGVLWRRPFAYMVDFLCIGLIIAVLWILFFFLGLVTLGLAWLLLTPGALFFFPIVAIGYHAILVGGPRAATWGMRLFDLEVRALDGIRPGFLQAGLQSLLFYATVPFTGSLILLVALLNPRGRLVHDFLSGTVVVRASAARGMPVP
jgi:uncharacterized RDD family membrane protein YckC